MNLSAATNSVQILEDVHGEDVPKSRSYLAGARPRLLHTGSLALQESWRKVLQDRLRVPCWGEGLDSFFFHTSESNHYCGHDFSMEQQTSSWGVWPPDLAHSRTTTSTARPCPRAGRESEAASELSDRHAVRPCCDRPTCVCHEKENSQSLSGHKESATWLRFQSRSLASAVCSPQYSATLGGGPPCRPKYRHLACRACVYHDVHEKTADFGNNIRNRLYRAGSCLPESPLSASGGQRHPL